MTTYLAFTLTMPGRNTWNGRWSGDEKLYVEVRKFTTKAGCLKADSIPGRHSYSWPDGWRASIEAKVVTAQEASALKRKSAGFCGYSWMVDSIIQHGAIYGQTFDEIAAKEVLNER